MQGSAFQEKGNKYIEMATTKRPREGWRCPSAGHN